MTITGNASLKGAFRLLEGGVHVLIRDNALLLDVKMPFPFPPLPSLPFPLALPPFPITEKPRLGHPRGPNVRAQTAPENPPKSELKLVLGKKNE